MLFNSYVFIFAFLPLLLLGFAALGASKSRRATCAWLVAGSLFYYGWWDPSYLVLLGASASANFALGTVLGSSSRAGPISRRKLILSLGVLLNLALLGYFKYANFFVETLATVTGVNWSIGPILLPLAISFFTFQQIAFLVDAYRGECREYDFLDYLLFVTFFPQLIAGPIVHHKEMMPQFARGQLRLRSEDLSWGGTLFTLGLAKKILLADTMAGYATPVFQQAAGGATPDFFHAWAGLLAYTLQIYFDFSGYSDMAIGLGRMFGIRLPVNFDSPYKATNIVEFWRRWHMTLSRFLRDYLYIPLGGNRKGNLRRHVNLLLTMLLGGLWHGAGWTFVVWGGLHGTYLIVNHAWSQWRPSTWTGSRIYVIACSGLTLAAVMLAWIFFRADSFASAWRMLQGLVGLGNGGNVLGSPRLVVLTALGFFAIARFLPNSQEWLARFDGALGARRSEQHFWWQWQPTWPWALAVTGMLCVSVWQISRYSEFIYFQF